MGGPELTLALKVRLLELKKIGLPRHQFVSKEVVDAQIVELGLLGAIRIENKRVRALPSSVQVSPELRPAHEALMKAPSWQLKGIRLALKMPTLNDVAGQLVERGVLCRRRYRRFGVLPVWAWETVDPRPRQDLAEQLRAVLLRGADPSPHDVALLLVLSDGWFTRLVGLNTWVQTAEARRIGVVASACPEGSFLRDFVRAQHVRWSDERGGLIDDLWDRFKYS
jgi:hypothetical protein